MFRKIAIASVSAALLLTAACSESKGGPHTEGIGPGGVAGEPSSAASVAPCGKEATQATWQGPLPQPGAMPAGSTMDRIKQKGFLTAGIDMSTWLFGYDPTHSNTPQGFDVDIARQIAKAIFGDDDHIRFRVVTLADPPGLKPGDVSPAEFAQLNDGRVDVVVRTTTITCRRLQNVNFSNPYFTAQQKVLVPKSLPATTSLQDLKGKKVCATMNSTAYHTIVDTIGSAYPNVTNALDCLALLQQGKVDAISTDDAILRGMAAQDPKVQITSAPSLGDQPYGILTAKPKTDLSEFVNGVLANIEADGTWAAIYKTNLGDTPSGAPAVPPVIPSEYPLG